MPEERTEITKEETVEKAKAKLTEEKDQQKDKSFVEPVVAHLLKRIEEDPGLAEDILQEHKTWEKCLRFINDKAREKLKNQNGYIDDPTVYEWSEDYYRKDDKAEEEEKKRKEEERKKKMEEDRKKREEQAKKKKAKEAKKETADSKDEKKEAPKPAPIAKSKKDIEGQMDLFSMFAQEGA